MGIRNGTFCLWEVWRVNYKATVNIVWFVRIQSIVILGMSKTLVFN